MIKAGKKILNAGINLSLYIILGLGSFKFSNEHTVETARDLTEIPLYTSKIPSNSSILSERCSAPTFNLKNKKSSLNIRHA